MFTPVRCEVRINILCFALAVLYLFEALRNGDHYAIVAKSILKEKGKQERESDGDRDRVSERK